MIIIMHLYNLTQAVEVLSLNEKNSNGNKWKKGNQIHL